MDTMKSHEKYYYTAAPCPTKKKKKNCITHAGLNSVQKTANGVLHNVPNALYQDILYFQNIIWFYDTCINVISFMATKKKYNAPCTDFHGIQQYQTELGTDIFHQTSPKLDN
jgi:hypothetical protein